jgi:acetyltransferase
MVTSHLKTSLSSLNNFAIVTHAGGPGVMLTDALSKGGLNVPKIEGSMADELKAQLFPGSSVANPIDFLATGTPAQLGTIIDYCEHKLDQIDAIAVIYGTPGLTQLYEAYSILDQKIRECKKPIFPILPSMVTAGPEVADFLAKGHVNFSDEVTLASTLSQIMRTPQPATHEVELYGVNISQLHSILFREIGRLKFEGKDSGWLAPNAVRDILT